MHKSKKTLMNWVFALDIVGGVMTLGLLLWSCLTMKGMYQLMGIELTNVELTYMIIFEIFSYGIDIALYVAGAVFIFLYVKKYEANFKLARKYFVIGLIINVLTNPLSIASILLYISYFKFPDMQIIKEQPTEEEPEQEIIVEEDVKDKIAKLRKLKEEGKITEEEFKDEIMKLL